MFKTHPEAATLAPHIGELAQSLGVSAPAHFMPTKEANRQVCLVGRELVTYAASGKAVPVLQREAALLQHLHQQPSPPVTFQRVLQEQLIEVAGQPWLLQARTQLPGSVLAPERNQYEFDEALKRGHPQQAARDFGGFLAWMHRVPPPNPFYTPPGMLPFAVEVTSEAMRGWLKQSGLQKDVKVQRIAEAALALRPTLADPAAMVMVYGDVNFRNGVTDPASGRLTGVIDFEHTHGGNRNFDLAYQVGRWDAPLLAALHDGYEAAGGPKINRQHVAAMNALQNLAFGVRLNIKSDDCYGDKWRMDFLGSGAPLLPKLPRRLIPHPL